MAHGAFLKDLLVLLLLESKLCQHDCSHLEVWGSVSAEWGVRKVVLQRERRLDIDSSGVSTGRKMVREVIGENRGSTRGHRLDVVQVHLVLRRICFVSKVLVVCDSSDHEKSWIG